MLDHPRGKQFFLSICISIFLSILVSRTISHVPTRVPCPVAALLPEGRLQLLRVLQLGAIVVPVKHDSVLLVPRSTKCSGNGRDGLWHTGAEDALGGKHSRSGDTKVSTLASAQPTGLDSTSSSSRLTARIVSKHRPLWKDVCLSASHLNEIFLNSYRYSILLFCKRFQITLDRAVCSKNQSESFPPFHCDPPALSKTSGDLEAAAECRELHLCRRPGGMHLQ